MKYNFWGWERADVAPLTKEYKGIDKPTDLYDALTHVWCLDTCPPRLKEKWTPDNKTVGQCSISAFLCQDIFGGRVYGIPLTDGNFHCFNVIGSCRFDLTSEQFGDKVLDYDNVKEQFREVHFAKEEKRLRYEFLKAGLKKYCDEEKVTRLNSIEPNSTGPNSTGLNSIGLNSTGPNSTRLNSTGLNSIGPNRTRFYLSSISDIRLKDMNSWPSEMINVMDSAVLADENGLGLEIAEYSISDNLESNFEETDRVVSDKVHMVPEVILHAPFNELFPCAVEPRALELANLRYDQAWELAVKYGAKKMVVHSGYNMLMYYESWFVERSIMFWKAFLNRHEENIIICLENIMETDYHALLRVVEGVKDRRLRITFDVGHAYKNSDIPIMEWLEKLSLYISHFHIHNNRGDIDSHGGLEDGDIPMEEFLNRALCLCPEATFTVEAMELEPSVRWLISRGYI